MADLEIIKTEVEEQLGIRQQHAPRLRLEAGRHKAVKARLEFRHRFPLLAIQKLHIALQSEEVLAAIKNDALPGQAGRGYDIAQRADQRSEEHTSELQSLMRISYAVFCLKKKTQ